MLAIPIVLEKSYLVINYIDDEQLEFNLECALEVIFLKVQYYYN